MGSVMGDSMKTSFYVLLLVLLTNCASASIFPHGTWLNASNTQLTDLDQLLGAVDRGSVVIVSELHGHKPHHQNQRLIIQKLKDQGYTVAVGMEFFNFTQQTLVDQYLDGGIEEADFLKQVKWGKTPYDNYKEQVLSTRGTQAKTLALNAPRSVSGTISKKGMDGLSPEQEKLLPPQFELGNKAYYERFSNFMGGHVPKESMDRYFTAQSLWDDTMAYVASEYMKQNPDHVLVIIVGDFHAAFGGGLPDRLEARGMKDVLVFTQVNLRGRDEKSQRAMIEPHVHYGPRGHGIFVSTEAL